MKQLLRFKTFLLMAVLSILAGTSAWAQTWEKTSVTDLNTGDIVVIVDETSSRAMSNDNGTSKAPTATEVTLSNDKITSTVTDKLKWEVTVDNGSYQFNKPNSSDYLYCTATNNGVRVGTNSNNAFTITTGGDNNCDFLKNTATSRYLGVYNNADWRCYTTINNNIKGCVTAFYKYVAAANEVAAPVFTPASGTTFGNEGLSVTISQADNKTIYYTLDGTEPTNASTQYNGSINLTTTTTIKAIAYDGTNASSVVTATYTYIDPNAPGQQNNPYTVAQAIANTPSSGSSDEVYIHGIVSSFYNTSITGDGTNYRYYISDDGTTSTQLLVFRGAGLNQNAFTDVNDLLVGDEVTIYGKLTLYQNASEVAAGNYLTSWTRPAQTVEAPSFSPAGGTYADAQSVTISCATDGVDIYYTTDGTDPDANSTKYSGAINVDATTTLKAIAYLAGENSTVATATYYICSAANPYTVTEALALPEYPANGVYVQGIVSTAPTQTPTTSGQLTYYISVDGQTTDQLQVYKGLGLNQAGFTAQDDIQVGDEVTIYGNVKIYNSTIEFDSGNYLVAFNRPVVATPSITITPDTYEMDAKAGGGELPVVCENLATDPKLAVVFVEADGTTPATYDWITATINANGNIDGQITANTGDARTAYFKVSGEAADGSTVYSNLVTFTQQAAATEPYIMVNTGVWDVDANGGSKTFGFDHENLGSNPTFDVKFFESDGVTETGCGWILYQFDPNDNKVTITASNNDENSARTVYFKVYAEVNKTTIYSNLVTINQAAPAAPVTGDYVKVTSSSDLTDGEYLIVYEDGALAFDGSLGTLDAVSNTVAVTIDNNTIASTTAVDAATFTVDVTAGTILSASGLYIGQTTDGNGMKTSDTEAYTNTISIDADGNAVILASGGAYLRYNATSGQERFRYFKSATYTSQKAIALYKKSSSPAPTTPSITLDGGYEYNVPAAGGDNELPVTCTNLAADPQLTVVFCDANGDAVADGTYDWIQASINANGNIAGHIDANTGDARTAYFKVSGKDADDNTIYSNLVTINQAAPAAPSIVFNPTSINFESNAGSKTIGGDYFSCKDFDSTPSLEILYYESNGETSATYDWLNVSVNTEGKIDIVYDENTGAARSAYLKLHASSTSVYSNLFTINQAAAADPNTIIFDFTTNDWGLPLTSENVSERREFKKDGYTIALTAGGNNKYGFNTDGYLLLGKNGATLEFPIFDFLVDKITIEGNTGASTSVKQAIYMKTYSEGLKQASSTTTGATGTNEYNISWGCQAAGEELLLQVTSAHNTQITRILIHKKETVDVTIGSTGYATLYYGDKNFSYGRKGGVSAYAVNLTNGALKMEAISNQAVIPAGTAMVLEGNPGTHVFEVEDAAFSSIAAEAEVNFTGCDNLLRGYDEPALTTGPDAGDYLFYLLGVGSGNKVGFYWGADNGAAFTSGAHKAYLAVPEEKAGGVRAFYFNDTTTGIDTLNLNVENENAYDLQGRRVQQVQKGGLYIINGKKMLAK